MGPANGFVKPLSEGCHYRRGSGTVPIAGARLSVGIPGLILALQRARDFSKSFSVKDYVQGPSLDAACGFVLGRVLIGPRLVVRAAECTADRDW